MPPTTHKIALIAPVDGLIPFSLVASDVDKKLDSVTLGTGLSLDSGGILSLIPSEIDHDSLLNGHQDVNTDGTPQFAGLTLTGNIVMPDGGTIGQAAGPLLTFDDTLNYLEITGCSVGIGTTTPGYDLDVAKSVNGNVTNAVQNTYNEAANSALAQLRIVASGTNVSCGFDVYSANYTAQAGRAANAIFWTNLGIGSFIIASQKTTGDIRFVTGTWDMSAGERLRIDSSGNVGLGQTTFGTNATKSLAISTGVAPTTSLTNAIQLYSADFVAGQACLHIRNENDIVVRLNQSLATTDSPTLAGLTLTSFSGIIKATTGVLAGGAAHADLTSIDTNQHIDHTTVSVSAGTGMSGGGTIAETRTLTCTITQYTDALARTACIAASISDGDLTHAPDGNSVFDALALKSPIASPTFTGTVTLSATTLIPDGGTIGQTAGPLLTFDDTLNYLNITGCNVSIGGLVPVGKLTVAATAATPSPGASAIRIVDGASNLWGWDFTLETSATGDLGLRRIKNGVATEVVHFARATGNVSIGIETATAKLHIDQSSTTGAIPVLTLDQADVSEEFIRFIGTAANDVITQSIVAAADVGVATIAGYVKVYVQDDGNQITDQAYYMPIYTLAAP